MDISKPLDAVEFIERIADAIRRGFGFNPLLGSGISAASGVIMGIEFSDYLAYSVFLALGGSRWDFRGDGWPPYPNPKEYKDANDWTLNKFRQICDRNGYAIATDDSHRVTKVYPALIHGKSEYSLADAVNCPPVPASIRSPHFSYVDRELPRLAASLRSAQRSADPAQRAAESYQPLWPREEQSPSSQSWLLELGIRSLADWRTTLHFLSRVEQQDNPPCVLLGDPEQSVVDRFNTFITADKQPNLAHKMIAHLARPLRIRTVLTTNFDTLIEDAFEQSTNHLTKFFVSNQGSLPDPFLVRAHTSIVKMHGELLETRADLTLNDEPKPLDKLRFLNYFFDIDSGKPQLRSMPANLLVMGFSASDMRIIRMIQHLLERTSAYRNDLRPNIYWICFNDSDRRNVSRLLPPVEYPGRIFVHQTKRPDLLLLELYQRLTLSLPGGGQTYEYNHNVPPTRVGLVPFDGQADSEPRVVYEVNAPKIERALRESTSQTPDQILAARDALARIAGHSLYEMMQTGAPLVKTATDVDRIYTILEGSKLPNSDNTFKVVRFKVDSAIGTVDAKYDEGELHDKDDAKPKTVLLFDTPCGALESLGVVHDKLIEKPGHSCLWFELADYVNSDSLLRDILRSFALRTGRFQREHVTLHPLKTPLANEIAAGDLEKVERELVSYLHDMCGVHRILPSNWTIFLYGRDVAGSCVGWSGTPWKCHDWNNLAVILRALSHEGFQVIFAMPTFGRIAREESKRERMVSLNSRSEDWSKKAAGCALREFINLKYHKNTDSESKSGLPSYYITDLTSGAALSLFQVMTENIVNKCLNDERFRSFFYAVTLFRQSRRPSALFYKAVQTCSYQFNIDGIDNDIDRAAAASGWVRWLESERVFYRKAGGHAWMHRDLRETVREILDKMLFESKRGTDQSFFRFHGQDLARSHFWIGDWYQKAFHSTGFAKPIIECLHHYHQAAVMARYALPKDLSQLSDANVNRPETVRLIAMQRFVLMRSAILGIIKTLISTRHYLKLWLANPHGFPMFGNDTVESNLRELNGAWKAIGYEKKKFGHEINKQLRLLETLMNDTNRAIGHESKTGETAYGPQFATTSGGALGVSYPKMQVVLDQLQASAYRNDWESETWNLAFDKAIKKICPLTTDEIVQLTAFDSENQQFDAAKFAPIKGQAICKFAPRFSKLLPVLAVFEALAYAKLRRAKFLGHSHPKINDRKSKSWNDVSTAKTVRTAWLRVTQLCNLAIDWCKHLPPVHLGAEEELKVRLHSYYAVALSNLDRFHEAHRHINEAAGINSKRESAVPILELSKLGIRRAEVLLTEAHRICGVIEAMEQFLAEMDAKTSGEKRVDLRERLGELYYLNAQIALDQRMQRKSAGLGENSCLDDDELVKVCIHPSILSSIPADKNVDKRALEEAIGDIQRLLIATVDDAWIAMENVERGLPGRSQSTLWWGRLALMKLRACGYQNAAISMSDPNSSIRMLAYRHRIINPQTMWEIFQKCFLNNKHCTYRSLRLIRYIAESLRVFVRYGDGVEFIRGKSDKKEGGKLAELRRLLDSIESRIETNPTDQPMKRIFDGAKESVDKIAP